MICESLTAIANNEPGRIAVIQGKRRVSYGELNTGVSRLASFLVESGIKTGDRIGIIIENSPEYIISYFGIQKAGGIVVAVNPQNSSYEMKRVFDNCLPDIFIAEKKALRNTLEAIADRTSVQAVIVVDSRENKKTFKYIKELGNSCTNINFFLYKDIIENENISLEAVYPLVNENCISSVIYTSGTTAEPKGVALSHNNFEANANSIIEYLHLSQNDKVMTVLPFYYSYGTSLLTTIVKVGGTLVLENSFMYPNVVLDKMVEEGVTGFAGVPSTFALLLNRSNIRKYSFKKLRYITQAGGAMSPKHARELSDIMPGMDLYIMYGQTEATARLTYLDPGDLTRKAGSIGKAIPGVSIELIKENGALAATGEEGEIVARGDNVMIGYWNKPEETAKVLRDGRLYTGDLAVRDSEGYLKIVCRRSDIIKSGAHRISPTEIEEVILEMPEVDEVAVVGLEDELLGAVIKAVIVVKEECVLDIKGVKKYCSMKLSAYKIPKVVIFAPALPKTSSGKVKRHLLEYNEAVI